MRLSKTSVATLLYLVELKIQSMEVTDTDDRRSQRALKRCRDELSALMRQAPPPKPSALQNAPPTDAGALVSGLAVPYP